VIESNQPKKPIPPGLKPIQPGERHQSASLHRVRFLVLEKFQPDRSEDVGRSFEAVLPALPPIFKAENGSRRWPAKSSAPLQTRVGIATGLVVDAPGSNMPQ
jgi:hypothetical protein